MPPILIAFPVDHTSIILGTPYQLKKKTTIVVLTLCVVKSL